MLNEYLHLITDPAHTAVELTFIMVDLLILGAVKRAIVRHLHRDLRNRDRAHRHNRQDALTALDRQAGDYLAQNGITD